MIVVKAVSKIFNGHVALNNISFEVAEGETLVLLGTSGSGKTTMLRLLNRLLEVSSGKIQVDNADISLHPPESLRRKTGYVLQGYGLFPHYTVAQNIGIVPSLLRWPKEKINERTNELLRKLQLPPEKYAHVYPDQLSGGQKQRVGLARALAADPPLLLMDEPFGALDPLTKAEIINSFVHLDELKKKTIVLVTHAVDEAMTLGDQIILLDKGKIVQQGKPVDFLTKPVNDFVKQFFAGQGFQSILQNTLLADIWPYLEDSNNNFHQLTSDQSLWQTLEYLLGNEGQAVVFKDGAAQNKAIDLEKLRTFYQTPIN